MVRLPLQHALLPLIFTLVACGSPQAAAGTPGTGTPDTSSPQVRLEPVVSDLAQPTSVVSADDGSGRLFITQKTGLVRVIKNGQTLSAPFLDLTGAVSTSSEQGLLGIAFHPDYAQNGRFFVNYTRQDGATVIAEYAVSDDPNVADSSAKKVLLTIAQPYSNHNGGDLVFGPDGYLYIGTGDGGAGGDPHGNAQNKAALLGKMLRIDVTTANSEPYGIPADNPFVGSAGARPEVWAYGLRNPWRFSFDRKTGDLWLADVGQNAFEEVDYQPKSSKGGENYGWNIMEADSCYNDAEPTAPLKTCAEQGLVKPVLAYSHSVGQSVTGGYVYRGQVVPALQGRYLYGDFVSGTLWSAAAQGDGSYQSTRLLDSGFNVVAFGEDETGELYVADFSGTLYRFAPAAQAGN